MMIVWQYDDDNMTIFWQYYDDMLVSFWIGAFFFSLKLLLQIFGFIAYYSLILRRHGDKTFIWWWKYDNIMMIVWQYYDNIMLVSIWIWGFFFSPELLLQIRGFIAYYSLIASNRSGGRPQPTKCPQSNKNNNEN